MRVYLRAKFEIFSIILTSFRLEGNLTLPPPTHTSKRIPKKPTEIRINKKYVSRELLSFKNFIYKENMWNIHKIKD